MKQTMFVIGAVMMQMLPMSGAFAARCMEISYTNDGVSLNTLVGGYVSAPSCCSNYSSTPTFFLLPGVRNPALDSNTAPSIYGSAYIGFKSCNTCSGVATRKAIDITYNGDTCGTGMYECVAPSCSDCSNGSWTAGNTGYQKKQVASCVCGVCKKDYEYRCAANYYGSSTNGTSGCRACPNGGKSQAGSTSITSCYLSTGTSGSDVTGSYQYTGNCYYKQ